MDDLVQMDQVPLDYGLLVRSGAAAEDVTAAIREGVMGRSLMTKLKGCTTSHSDLCSSPEVQRCIECTVLYCMYSPCMYRDRTA